MRYILIAVLCLSLVKVGYGHEFKWHHSHDTEENGFYYWPKDEPGIGVFMSWNQVLAEQGADRLEELERQISELKEMLDRLSNSSNILKMTRVFDKLKAEVAELRKMVDGMTKVGLFLPIPKDCECGLGDETCFINACKTCQCGCQSK